MLEGARPEERDKEEKKVKFTVFQGRSLQRLDGALA
jgi:hypothetical protein